VLLGCAGAGGPASPGARATHAPSAHAAAPPLAERLLGQWSLDLDATVARCEALRAAGCADWFEERLGSVAYSRYSYRRLLRAARAEQVSVEYTANRMRAARAGQVQGEIGYTAREAGGHLDVDLVEGGHTVHWRVEFADADHQCTQQLGYDPVAVTCMRRGPPPAPSATPPARTPEEERLDQTDEARDHLASLIRQAAAYVSYARVGRPMNAPTPDGPQMPHSAPRTPAQVPRGRAVVDPPGTWDLDAWRDLQFSISEPHRYSYEFIVEGLRYTARAVGDLDGDGVYSTFERSATVDPQTLNATPTPLRVENELE
jgi:hypothetical protein